MLFSFPLRNNIIRFIIIMLCVLNADSSIMDII